MRRLVLAVAVSCATVFWSFATYAEPAAPAATGLTFAPRLPSQAGRGQGTSDNWAGYVLTGNVFTSVAGQWVVPSVSYVRYANWSGAEVSATWVGIGGSTGDATLIQLGTTQAVDAAGTVAYYAWYLLVDGLNNAAVRLPNPVSPGDQIEASLQCVTNCVANATQSWRMTIRNRTKNWVWDNNGATFSYRSSLAAADWIMEAATRQAGGQISYLPKYGSVTFENASANGANPNLSLLRDGLAMVNAAGLPISIPTAATGGNSFTVNQANLPPSPPLPNTPTANICKNGTDLGEWQNQRQIQGTIDAVYGAVFYRFYIRQYTLVQGFPLGVPPRHYDYVFVDDVTGREMATTSDGAQWPNLSIDPGYYCVKIFRNDSTLPPIPYKIDMIPLPAGGFIPPSAKANAFRLPQLELGYLVPNGYYGTIRYIWYKGNTPNIPLQLDPNHIYVLRDWLGAGKSEQWYNFTIDQIRTINVKLSNLYLGASASLETEDGTIVGATVPGGSAFGPWLPSQVFKGALPAGMYYLRIVFAGTGGPGTPFQLELTAH
jgi:hypothetical protein